MQIEAFCSEELRFLGEKREPRLALNVAGDRLDEVFLLMFSQELLDAKFLLSLGLRVDVCVPSP